MRLTKRSLIKTAAIGSAFVGALAVAAPASANSFGPTGSGTGNLGTVSYDDGADQFCATATQHYGLSVELKPENSRRGPSYTIHAAQGETKCVSLARAYEDTHYSYQVTNGWCPPPPPPVFSTSPPPPFANHSPPVGGAPATPPPLPRHSSPRQHFCCRGLENIFKFLSGDLAGLLPIRLHTGGKPMRPSTPPLLTQTTGD